MTRRVAWAGNVRVALRVAPASTAAVTATYAAFGLPFPFQASRVKPPVLCSIAAAAAADC